MLPRVLRGYRFVLLARACGFPETCIASQLGRLVGRFPCEVGIAASEVSIGRGLLVDRTAQIQRVDDAARRQLECARTISGMIAGSTFSVPKVSTRTLTGSATPIAYAS